MKTVPQDNTNDKSAAKLETPADFDAAMHDAGPTLPDDAPMALRLARSFGTEFALDQNIMSDLQTLTSLLVVLAGAGQEAELDGAGVSKHHVDLTVNLAIMIDRRVELLQAVKFARSKSSTEVAQ